MSDTSIVLLNDVYPQPVLINSFNFINNTTTEIYALSVHDALPIWLIGLDSPVNAAVLKAARSEISSPSSRSEEHTSELQSRGHLVCRLLLEKKNINTKIKIIKIIDLS